jgi:probable F420-dependent oxidoreductase
MRIEAFHSHGTWQQTIDAAVFAEARGFDAFTLPEIDHDPFLRLGFATRATSRIGVRTAIAVAFPRSPMVVANTAWDLHNESGGRFVLGLGTQVKPHVERRFSTPWSKPKERLGEYVQSIRAIHRAWEKQERLKFEGQHYQFTLMTPEFSPKPTGRNPVPIYTSAVRPAMLEFAGEVSDGVRLHGFMTRKYFDTVAYPAIAKGLESRGRPRSNFEICGGGFLATGPDEEAAMKMRELIRYRVAFYASTPSYWPVLEAHGWQDLGEKLNAMTREGKWAELSSQIPDDVLDAFCVTAPWSSLKTAMESRFGGICDSVELGFTEELPSNEIEDLVKDLHTIATPCSEVTTSWE